MIWQEIQKRESTKVSQGAISIPNQKDVFWKSAEFPRHRLPYQNKNNFSFF